MAYSETFSAQHGSATTSHPAKPDLTAEYGSSREQLERLMAAPVKDFPALDELVGRLELLQLAIKEEHGIKGNNPNE